MHYLTYKNNMDKHYHARVPHNLYQDFNLDVIGDLAYIGLL